MVNDAKNKWKRKRESIERGRQREKERVRDRIDNITLSDSERQNTAKDFLLSKTTQIGSLLFPVLSREHNWKEVGRKAPLNGVNGIFLLQTYIYIYKYIVFPPLNRNFRAFSLQYFLLRHCQLAGNLEYDKLTI